MTKILLLIVILSAITYTPVAQAHAQSKLYTKCEQAFIGYEYQPSLERPCRNGPDKF